MESGTSSCPILFSFVKLFFPSNNLKNNIVIPSEMHIDSQFMSSSSEVENGFLYKYMEEKRIKTKISIFLLDKKSFQFPSGTLFPAILLIVMIHGTRQRPDN